MQVVSSNPFRGTRSSDLPTYSFDMVRCESILTASRLHERMQSNVIVPGRKYLAVPTPPAPKFISMLNGLTAACFTHDIFRMAIGGFKIKLVVCWI